MPHTRSTPTKPAVRTMQASRRRLLLVVASVLLLMIAVGSAYGINAFHKHALRADRARFTQAERDIADLSQAIIATTGQPLKVDTQKFCSRPSVEIGKGPLSCDVGTDLFYGVNDETQATALFKKTSTVLQTRWRRTSIKYSNNLSSSNGFEKLNTQTYVFKTDYQQIFENFQANVRAIECTGVYDYYKSTEPPYGNFLNTNSHQGIIAVSIGCADFAKSEYFPGQH